MNINEEKEGVIYIYILKEKKVTMDYGCKLFLILHDFNRKRESLIAVENVSFVPFFV